MRLYGILWMEKINAPKAQCLPPGGKVARRQAGRMRNGEMYEKVGSLGEEVWQKNDLRRFLIFFAYRP